PVRGRLPAGVRSRRRDHGARVPGGPARRIRRVAARRRHARARLRRFQPGPDELRLHARHAGHRAAVDPECDPGTGVGCTSGRADEDLSDMESPASHETERIDYFFLVRPGAGSLCAATIDTGADADGDGTATRIFADDPNPFAPTCGPAPDAICWPSDHEGAQVDLNCG